jgi:hypothetical protein
MAATSSQIPAPETVWDPSVMTDEKIQALVERGLLQPKAEVERKAPAGEVFSMENDKEHVIFTFFFKCEFNVPADDFFRGLLYYYKLELVHLVPNSITVVLSFIHLCKAYLGIPPNFLLWRYFFNVKTTVRCTGVVGSVMFCLRPGLKAELIDMDLPDNTFGWRSEWFYLADQKPALTK